MEIIVTPLMSQRTGTVSYYRVFKATEEAELVVRDVEPLIKECAQYGLPYTLEALVNRWNTQGKAALHAYYTPDQEAWRRPKGALDFLASDL